MRVLILGCGYVGTPLGAVLVKQGHEVFGLRRRPGADAALAAVGIKPLAADITRLEELSRLPAGYDWVVNCVASSGGGAEDYRWVYLQGTGHLLEWLAASPPRKFVYTSSTSVYGQTDGSLVTETSSAEPAVETARVLVETEKALVEAAERSGFPAVVLRLAGIYGPGRGHWFKQYLSGMATIEGKGERVLNMIHRDDVVTAIVSSLRQGQPGRIYNVVDDEPVTQLDFFKWLSNRLGRALPPFAPRVLAGTGKRGTTNKRVSNLRMKDELGWPLKYPTFREGYEDELRRLE